MAKKILMLIIIFTILGVVINTLYGMYKEAQLSDGPQVNETAVAQNNNSENIILSNKIRAIRTYFQGYKVSAELTIPKINLSTYVLEEYDEEAMWLCPTKYFGPEPNEIGNYCIAAHNYDKENMFNHIIELTEGDKIILSDNKNGSVFYEVYDVYKVEPNQTEVLSQQTEGNTDITLITCSDYSSKRIIVKARRS